MSSRLLAAVVAGLMVGVSLGAALLTPRIHLSDELGQMALEEAVPTAFGDWKLDRSGPAYVVNPQAEAILKTIYSQTLSRAYVNGQGYRVMLSIAYGGDQRDAMQVHYPEVCYPAQGFTVHARRSAVVDTPLGQIPVRRLETSLGVQRPEPVSYWTMVGERVVRGEFDKKGAEMSYGLRGRIPDGLLFRVSSIDPDSGRAFGMQDRFVQDVVAALPARQLSRIAGLRVGRGGGG